MKLSQKRTCNGCKLEGSKECSVAKRDKYPEHELGFLMTKIPMHKCFKPVTNKDYFEFIGSLRPIQNAESRIFMEGLV